jgi:hypothetical protein
MDPNTQSTERPPRRPNRLAALATHIDQLLADDPDQLPDAQVAEEVLELRRLLDRLDGQWLQRLATVDGGRRRRRSRPGDRLHGRLAAGPAPDGGQRGQRCPHHPGHLPGPPADRPGRPRPRLCGPRLPPAAGQVRRPAPGQPAGRRPDRPPHLALFCRAHHRAVHEGGWRLTRAPDGRGTAIPPHRRDPGDSPATAHAGLPRLRERGHPPTPTVLTRHLRGAAGMPGPTSGSAARSPPAGSERLADQRAGGSAGAQPP